MKGYIQVYTGDGKGKTTAAFGLALRAVGAGKKVFIAQFIKGKPYSEIDAVNSYIPTITVKQYGLDCFIYNQPTAADIDAARRGLAEVATIVAKKKYDMVVLDEICIALYYNIFSVSEVVKILTNKPEQTEIIVTGRYAPNEIIAIADLVTEMREVKHYYSKGVEGRKGIEF
jgi:cob(I)alamin adenosyltransferase